jgi:hypothetical protein
MDVTIFLDSKKKIIGYLTITDVLNQIRNGDNKSLIEYLRDLLDRREKNLYDQHIKKLYAFISTGVFRGGLTTQNLKRYSGLMSLDFNKVESVLLPTLKIKICSIPFTYACFLSPNGQGFNVLVRTDAEIKHHEGVYQDLSDYFNRIIGIRANNNCKEISGLSFISWDPEVYINKDSLTFSRIPANNHIIQTKEKASDMSGSEKHESKPDYEILFAECIHFTEKIISYIPGNRIDFVYFLACNCNRKGIPSTIAKNFISGKYDLEKSEVNSSVKSAYSYFTAEFANFANSAMHVEIHETDKSYPNKIQVTEEGLNERDLLKETLIIPDDVILNLPELLRSGAESIADKRERDVFLTGAITILSGCFHNVSGIYDQDLVYPNLFCLIVAPPACGKGVLKLSKKVALKIHEKILTKSKADINEYKIQREQDSIDKKSKNSVSKYQEKTNIPLLKVLFIPANCSYAKLIIHLRNNDGKGVICETEADTMVNTLKKEWGSYSDLLRKAFHHETVSSSKKNDDEYIEIEETRLSVALSGTFSQVIGLITSSEDGLFSRFIYYIFKVEQKWRDVSPIQKGVSRNTLFSQLSQKALDISEFLEKHPTVVELTKSQWELLNETFAEMLAEVVLFNNEEASSVVKRLGLITFRIAMILSCLRKVENKDTVQIVFCTDNDFNTALILSKIYLHHSLLLFANLTKQTTSSFLEKSNNKRQFLEALPQEFKRIDAIELGKKYSLAARTVDSFLKELIGKYLFQPSYGVYKKV